MLSTAHTEEIALVPTPGQEDRRRELLGDIERLRASRASKRSTSCPRSRLRFVAAIRFPATSTRGILISATHSPTRSSDSATAGPTVHPMSLRTPAASRRAPKATADDVGTLFEALRTTAEVDVLVGTIAPDPISFHESVVVPAFNLGLRDLKRRIVDLQAVALEGLRSTGWSPEARAVMTELAPSLDQAIQRASVGGVDAARVLGGVEVHEPVGSDRARKLISMMSQQLTSELRAAGAGETGPEETAVKMSRVFRTWRTDEIERWVRHRRCGLSRRVAPVPLPTVATTQFGGFLKDRRAECPAASGAAWNPSGPPPDGTRLPPAHLGCTCTIAPV